MNEIDEPVCDGCSMPQSEWEGNGGSGYQLGSETYCCRGCADGSGCTCTAHLEVKL